MPIEPGARFPQATLAESTEFGDACPIAPQKIDTAQAVAGKTIAIFGVPGAFTPTCSERHVPGYLRHYEALKQKGVDEVWCIAVNDGFVMAAWGKQLGALGKIRFLGDGSAELTKKLGLELDLTPNGMGVRLRRCSLLVKDGVVARVNVEAPGKLEVSSAEAMLEQLG